MIIKLKKVLVEFSINIFLNICAILIGYIIKCALL